MNANHELVWTWKEAALSPVKALVYNLLGETGRVVNIPALYSVRPGLNLGPETGYPEFSWFYSAPPGNSGIVP
jgi:hypothetical protein